MNTLKSFSRKISLKSEKCDFHQVNISSSKDAAEYANGFYFDDIDIYESSFIILLNQRNNTIGYAKLSQGGITSTVIDPKIVLKFALDSLATGFILVHNHPSGNIYPSQQDKNLTRAILQVSKLLDVNFLDHIIITSDNYYSLADNGQLN